MSHLETEVAQGGKVEISSAVATAMGWQAGEKLTVQVQDGEVRIFSQASGSPSYTSLDCEFCG